MMHEQALYLSLPVSLTNSLTRDQEIFVPYAAPHVSLYVCGITPYDFSHLGHGRCYANFDVLVRLLRFLGYQVTYVRNFTDIDDKIIAKAGKPELEACRAISEQFITAYEADMRALRCLEPDHQPRVTELIPEIITYVEKLIASGHAYVLDGDVYFDVKTFAEYGKLSGKKLDQLEAGARVGIDLRKRNPGDFALWKGNDQELFWSSPWGYGRPGWHIECSVMAEHYLGSTIDLHAGGMDLMFPHHENEIAQSEGLHQKPFARYWLHNAFIMIKQEKMSKSLGNFMTLKDVFSLYDPMVLRYFFLQHHYRTPIDFSDDQLQGTTTAYKKLLNFGQLPRLEQHEMQRFCLSNPLARLCIEALCDDLNTPKLLGIIFEHMQQIRQDEMLSSFVRTLLHDVLGLSLKPLAEAVVVITPEIQALIEEREKARAARDWKQADRLRDLLQAKGVDLRDKQV